MDIEQKLENKLDLPLTEVIELYNNGFTLQSIGDKYKVSPETIRNRLRFANIPMRSRSQAARLAFKQGRKGKRLNLPLDEIIKLYQNGLSKQAIADKYGVSDSTIWLRLQLANVPLRSSSEAGKLAFKQGRRIAQKGEKSFAWKGGRVKSGTGYIWLKLRSHPRANKAGYVAEHIVIWEEIHNRLLPDGWAIHHLNGVKDDNRPENLVAMPDKRHTRLIPIYRQRIRELEAKVKLLERALDNQQIIWWTEN